MPHHCSAWGCKNRLNAEIRGRGITFHRFPKNRVAREKWEVALRRKGFFANPYSRLCSEHFRREDFDRTGQTVRLRDGVVPSVFDSPPGLKLVAARTTWKLKQLDAATPRNQPVDCSPPAAVGKPQPEHSHDHSYALFTCPGALKARLTEALAEVESLEREKRDAKDQERRAKGTVRGLLVERKAKSIMNKELKEKLNLNSAQFVPL